MHTCVLLQLRRWKEHALLIHAVQERSASTFADAARRVIPTTRVASVLLATGRHWTGCWCFACKAVMHWHVEATFGARTRSCTRGTRPLLCAGGPMTTALAPSKVAVSGVALKMLGNAHGFAVAVTAAAVAAACFRQQLGSI